MATIITKNSSTASSVPAAGSLQQGELAVNVTDKKLYTKDSSAAVVKLVGSLGNQEANAVAITGGTINGTAIGGTTPAAAAFTTASASGGFTGNLTGNASTVTNGVYTTGSYADPAWITSLAGSKITGNISGNAANVTGTVAIANGGTGLTALGTGVQTALGQTVTGSGGIVLAASPSLTTPNLGTPSAVTLTNATGLPVSTGISGLGTNVATALGVSVGSAGSVVVNGGALGTPSSGTLTNATGLPLSTGVTGTLAVANGGTGITAFGSGVATALGVNVGSAGAFVVNGGALGTPSSGTVTNLTGTASININGTVGATTPNTGSFTTLTTSSTVTINGGTVNGVAYLNGSKVLTTGSALTFNGTSLGVGSSAYGDAGTITASIGVAGSTAGGLQLWASSAQEHYIQWGDSTSGSATYAGAISYSHASDFMRFWTNSTEQMRLTSTGLGIGTSSPGTKLHVQVSALSGYPGVANAGALIERGNGPAALNIASPNTENGIIWFADQDSASVGNIRYEHSSNTLSLRTNGSDRFYLDSSGNLGLGVTPSGYLANKFVINTGTDSNNGITIASATNRNGSIWFADGTTGDQAYRGGVDYQHTNDTLYLYSGGLGNFQLTAAGNIGLGVTPSAWNSDYKSVDVNVSGSFYARSAVSTAGITQNALRNSGGSWIYKQTNAASRFDLDAGAAIWFTAPSGTAGNAISFTQALTLDANRNLLLNGTTAGASSVGTLTIFNGTAPTGSVTDGVILFAQDVSASSELRVRDEAGNVTTLSPHNFELIPEGPSEDMAWAYYSEKNGKKINVDMLKLARMVEKLTGEKLVYEA